MGYQPVSPYRVFVRDLIYVQKTGGSSTDFSQSGKVKIEDNTTNTKLFSNVSGIRFLVHSGGCGETRHDSAELCGLLEGYITHPNVAGATVLSLGCFIPWRRGVSLLS